MGARVRMGATLALVAALLLWLHRFFPAGTLTLVVITALAGLGVWELDHMGSLRGRELGTMLHVASLVMTAVLALPLLGAGWPGLSSAPGSLLFLYGAALACSLALVPARWLIGLRGAEGRVPAMKEFLPAAAWLLPPLYAVVLLDRAFGVRGLVVLVVLAKVGDNAGYFVGRAIGRHHPFPRLSPGKTLAGCLASLAAGVVTGAVLLPPTLGGLGGIQVAVGALLGGLINLAAQAGDLSESWVKRLAGVKDSSSLLGASGGVLDVIDSLLLAAPVALVLFGWAYGASEPIP